MAEKHNTREKKTCRKNGGRKTAGRKTVLLASALAAGLLSAGSAVYASTDGEVINYMADFMSGGTYYDKTQTDESGMENPVVSVSSTAVPLEESGFPLLLEDGRLYFTGDGGKTDITEKISETEPYYINVKDDDGNMHVFNIGGRAEEGRYGYQEMLFDGDGNFLAGSGRTGSDDGTNPEWAEKGRKEMTGRRIGDE